MVTLVSLGWGSIAEGGEPDPREARLGCGARIEPVGRFPPSVEAYRLDEGRGKRVGVEGRDMDVGIELAVDAVVLVLALPSDIRDCGLRIPVPVCSTL